MTTRDDFEGWLTVFDSEITKRIYEKNHPMYPNQYMDFNAHIAFHAWQAATEKQQAEIERLNNEIEYLNDILI